MNLNLKISKYWKGVIAGAAPVLAAIQAGVDDGHIDVGEWLTIAGAVLIAFGVWRVPNKQ
jgi:hypothetical protein